MKKKSILKFMFGTLLLGVVGLSSCKKCYTCTNGSYTEEVCQGSSQSQSSFKAYIKYLKAQGLTCK